MSVKEFLNELLSYNPQNKKQYDKFYIKCRRKYKMTPSKSSLLKIYRTYNDVDANIVSLLIWNSMK